MRTRLSTGHTATCKRQLIIPIKIKSRTINEMDKNNKKENENVVETPEMLSEAKRLLDEEKQRSDRAAEMRARAEQRLKEKEAHYTKLKENKKNQKGRRGGKN